jgi:alcohol dehydrogenase, propanol-preferring
MKAWLLDRIHDMSRSPDPLSWSEIPVPVPAAGELLIQVKACGVCHTEIDEIEGRTIPPVYPVVPGHQVVGVVAEKGAGIRQFNLKDRVGVGWIWSACGKCGHCMSGNDNLCEHFLATGRDRNGGYAQFMVVPEKYAFPIPDTFTDLEAAPLLCAGSVGYRSLRLCNLKNGEPLGLTGFGASGHLVLKLARHLYPESKVMVFARSKEEQRFALDLGAYWAGDTNEASPVILSAIIDTTPVWKPVLDAMRSLAAGGRLVINAIRKEDIDKKVLLELDYASHLWMEKEIKSVANVSRKDIAEFIKLAAKFNIRPEVAEFHFEEANRALQELKLRKIRGAKVLVWK